ncbi:MAG: adenylyltransferase/cytidyltransferase family protein [Candidatus Promineifilaceae bacterium]|jgi:cytidyltransferase-like protein
MNNVIVSGSFDDIRFRDIRFLEIAARLGSLDVLLWSDKLIQQFEGEPPKFNEDERMYFLKAVRYVNNVILVDELPERDAFIINEDIRPSTWVVREADDSPFKRSFCSENEIVYRVISEEELVNSPLSPLKIEIDDSAEQKVIVTGCFDWLHSGHVRFFEETSELGDLYVVLGHDENVRLLKGEGHPQFPEYERRYMVQSIRFVKQAMVSSGHGWMDAEPEIALLKPDIYAVNEDGDKPEKQAFCAQKGLEYVVLKRSPKEGLPQRTSTDLRGY